MYRGRIIGMVGPDTPREEIGLLMAGITPDTAGGEAAGATPTGGAAPTPEGPGNEDEA
jgi:simple sugar transport system ATP-binding protein